MNRRHQTSANKIGGKALFSGPPAIMDTLSHQAVFQKAFCQNRAWQDKPVNISAANFLIFPAKWGNLSSEC
jgi:DNA polymerase III delta prime subunit